MKCPKCRHDNEEGAKFCEECAAPLARACAKCGRRLSPTAKFCPECAHPTGVVPGSLPATRFTSPDSYTPKHLAEKILSSKAALEGERKQVTVLFADLKGSMELLENRDPEEARKLLDPVLKHMMEAVHHYDGTVNQVMGDGIMALFGAPVAQLSTIRQALDVARTSSQRGREAHALRLLGDVQAFGGETNQAAASYVRGLTLGGELGMCPLVAHCHLGLGKLYGRTGKRQQAHEHLTTATTMYREMGMGFWLEKAEQDKRETP